MNLPKHDAGLYLTHDAHKGSYMSVEDWIEEQEGMGPLDWATPNERERAIETDSVWDLQWYPVTPVGFYRVLGASLDAVLQAAEA